MSDVYEFIKTHADAIARLDLTSTGASTLHSLTGQETGEKSVVVLGGTIDIYSAGSSTSNLHLLDGTSNLNNKIWTVSGETTGVKTIPVMPGTIETSKGNDLGAGFETNAGAAWISVAIAQEF